MVDRDSIESRFDDNETQDTDSGSPDGDSIDLDRDTSTERKSKTQKVEEFKKASGVSSADTSKGSKVPMKDGREILRAIANMVLYAEGTLRALDDPDNAREKKKKEIAETAYNQVTDIISEKRVQRICEKYGIDWQEDIIEDVLKEQDYDSKVGLN